MKYYGQDETDRIIEEYFPGKYNGYCVEVGAYDGIANSNTYYFEKNKNWSCVCIEPNPNIFPALSKNREICYDCACSDYVGWNNLTIYHFPQGKESALTSLDTDPRLIDHYSNVIQGTSQATVIVNTLDEILSFDRLRNFGLPDFVSIDTEGTELRVLQGFDLNRWQPILLVIEENYEDTIIKDYLSDFGYFLERRNGVNNFYVRN